MKQTEQEIYARYSNYTNRKLWELFEDAEVTESDKVVIKMILDGRLL